MKSVGTLENYENKNGEKNDKLSLIISTKEIRSSDNGLYAADQDFSVIVYGKLATEFSLKPGDWFCGSLNMTARKGQNNIVFQDMKLYRYVRL